MKLKIVESSWSGWSSDYEPYEIEKEYDIKLNEKYVIKTMLFSHEQGNEWIKEEREVFSFDIIEVNNSSIKIRTYQSFSDNGNGTINLYSKKKEFVVTSDKPLELITPTMDEGLIFILSLVK